MKTEELKTILPVSWNEVSAVWYRITLEGLKNEKRAGDRSRGNAALLLGRILFRLEEQLEFVLSELDSHAEEDSVPERASMLIGIAEDDGPVLEKALAGLEMELRQEYTEEGTLRIEITEEGAGAYPSLHPVAQQKLIFYLIQLPDGILKTEEKSGQPELYCYLNQAELMPDGFLIRICLGSRLESAGKMLADRILYLTEFLGGESYETAEMQYGYTVME